MQRLKQITNAVELVKFIIRNQTYESSFYFLLGISWSLLSVWLLTLNLSIASSRSRLEDRSRSIANSAILSLLIVSRR